MAGGIQIDGVSKKFRSYAGRAGSLKEAVTRGTRASAAEFWALNDVTFDIPEGSMFSLIGHNGSGKSTLLRCIAGIYQPTTGTITAKGRLSALLELGSGFHPDLSGRENVYLNASIIGLSRKEIDRVFDEIVEFAEVEDFIDTPIRFYSSGMYVRLGFAVAVHVNPEILIVDEVIAVGDERFQRRCFDYLYDLRQKGVTIVMVTHSLSTVQTMSDSAAWLDHGELQMVGDSGDVVRAYLDRVNRAERSARPGGGDASEMAHHGSGEIVVSRIEILDAAGDPVGVGTHGEPLVIRLHFDTAEPIERPVFALTLRQNNMVVASSTTQASGVDLGRLEGTGFVDYAFDEFPVMPGSYEIFTSIYDDHGQHAYFHQDGPVHLPVRPGARTVLPGLVELPAVWRTDS